MCLRAILSRLALLFVLVADLPAPAEAQSVDGPSAAEGPVATLLGIDVDAYPEVRLKVRVTDGDAVVGGLGPRDFRVWENDVIRGDLRISGDVPPLSVVLAVDSSGSMGAAMEDAKSAAQSLVDRLGDDDAAHVLAFADTLSTLSPMTTDKARLGDAIFGLRGWGNTRLFDAVATSVGLVSGRTGERTAVVLLSDGNDADAAGNRLSALTEDDVIAVAENSGVPVFAIGLGDAINDALLTRMAEVSGGAYFHAPEAAALEDIYQRIADTLLAQDYAVSYTSPLPADGRDRRIEVLVAGPNGGLPGAAPRVVRMPGQQIGRFAGTPGADPAPAAPTAPGSAVGGAGSGAGGGAGGGAGAGGGIPAGAPAGAAAASVSVDPQGTADDLASQLSALAGGAPGTAPPPVDPAKVAEVLGVDVATLEDGFAQVDPAIMSQIIDVSTGRSDPPVDPATMSAALSALGADKAAQGASGVFSAGQAAPPPAAGAGCSAADGISRQEAIIRDASRSFGAGGMDNATRVAVATGAAERMAQVAAASQEPRCLEAALDAAIDLRQMGAITPEALQSTNVILQIGGRSACANPADAGEIAACDRVVKVQFAVADDTGSEPAGTDGGAEGFLGRGTDFLAFVDAELRERFGPMGPWFAVGGLGLILILLTLPAMLVRQEDPLDKLRRSQMADGDLIEGTRLRQRRGGDKLEKYSNFLEPQDKAEYTAIQLKLLQAGYRTKNAVRMYHFAQFALGTLFLLGGVVYAIFQTQTGEPTTQATALSIIIPGAIGYMLPKYWVNKRQQERQKEIENGFPDSLDMMLVCVEAGQSLDQSIIRVARELKAGFPALSWEFELVAYEMKAGKDKTAVLKDMAERCGVPDITSFVTVLVQSQQFGTSIAEALRVYAGEMRDKRVMRAEEKANTLPTKMTLATMMLTVPPLLIILIGPSVYDIYENLVVGTR